MLEQLKVTLRKNKLFYYLKNISGLCIPPAIYRSVRQRKLAQIHKYSSEELMARVNYYNKLDTVTPVGDEAIAIKDIDLFKKPKAYNFDTIAYTRYFPEKLKANFLFGDIVHTADYPSFQKSRPISDDNANAVILKLDKKRHFLFIKDKIPFASKKNMLIGRGTIVQDHRIRFMEMYFGHPLCDLGKVNKYGGYPEWIKPKTSLQTHLEYKFILSLEGHDVATNLKWIMSSNSIAVMPKPRYETWYMEGKLIPDFHYIEIKADYSDLPEKLNYYIQHTDKAETIIKNANAYIEQFLDSKKEDLISLLVIEKYFHYTNQMKAI